MATQVKLKRKSGIQTGNAGEYYVLGELLRRGFDAQLAEGRQDEATLTKVQVKSVRLAPCYVKLSDFERGMLDRTTIYVLVGPQDSNKPVRYFIARNRDVKKHLHRPKKWENNAFMPMRAVEQFEDRWDTLSLAI